VKELATFANFFLCSATLTVWCAKIAITSLVGNHHLKWLDWELSYIQIHLQQWPIMQSLF